MERKQSAAVRNRNVFKGCVLISLLVESHPRHFPNRAVACRLARRLFKEGSIRSIFGAQDFEDSPQLYMWNDGELTKHVHGGNMTSPPTSSCSNSNSSSKPEERTYRQQDWQLIQDIRAKLLNRSEAYNIVTSYNTFFQELEQDFGYDHSSVSHKKSPSGGSDVVWSDSNTHFTSTLELKKDPVYSTDSSLDHQTYIGKFRDSGQHKKKNSKHSSVSPHSKCSSSKDASPHISHETSPHLNSHQQHSHPAHHHLNKHQQHQSTPEMNKEPTGNVNTEHAIFPDERLSNANLNSEQLHLSPSDAATMDYQDGSHRHGTIASGQKPSIIAENLENKNTRDAEASSAIVGDRGNRWPLESFNQQLQPACLEMHKWLDPGASHFSGNQQWMSENNRPEVESGLMGESRSRWPENVVSDGIDSGRRWPESIYSYSDNEKQLLEEMRRMKKEHQNVLRTYEGRVNKLMAKMHELRSIAEMLEHSSNKSSPYGILPGKLALLNILGGKALDGKKAVADSAASEDDQVPPPLPPRPGRGSRVYPNKPIIHTSVTMKPLPWSRIILESDGGEQASTVWHGMTEPKIDTEELQRLFSGSSDLPTDINLYDDICLRRGRNQTQLVSIYDAERSHRIASEMRALLCTLPEVIHAFVTLNCDGLHTDSFAELLELLTSPKELEKIFHHVKKRGAGQLDAPEYLVFELSKVDHFRERLEFLRFKNKIQINLFEIDQQLRELQTACDEITSSTSLKHVLETVLAVGNHMNAGTDRGQADGFRVDVLNSLKDMQDLSKQCNLLELIMRTYCLKLESDLNFGCPTRFRLPEPSNMRHAAQVSFEDIQRALKELKDELSIVRNKLESLSKREGSTLTIALRVTSENFMSSAVEVLAEEQKLLEETRAQFWKTASFFSFDGQKSTPREFFQIWASFLHDCKYYWKLAHRNLAKAKFNTDLATKSQLSSSSLPGFNSLKSVMMKHVASFQQDEEMRASKSHQLQHINSWIQSVGRYTMEMQPEGAGSSLETKDSTGRHSGAIQGHDRKKLQSQQQEPEQSSLSPAYKNVTEPKDKINLVTDLDRQFQQENKLLKDSAKTTHSNSSRYNVRDVPQIQSSPKPIKATPPNVIKPQPIVHTSSSLNNAPATSSDHNLAKPLSHISYQPTVPEIESGHKHGTNHHDDNFGFEPLYESLSHYSQNHPDLHLNDVPGSHQEGSNDFAFSGNSLSPDPDNTQRKKFFKSLLKRDQKRPHANEESPQSTQASPHKNMSAPFSKVKNTFVQKFSGSGNAKNSNSDLLKDYSHSVQNQIIEGPKKIPQGLSSEHEAVPYQFSNRDTAHFDNSSGGMKDKDRVSYQNVCFPDQTRRSEALSHIHTPNSLEVNPDHPEKTFYREDHESFPSTVSSLQSIRDKSRSNYQGNILLRRDNVTNQQNAFDNRSRGDTPVTDKHMNRFHTDNSDGLIGAAGQSSQSRVRAPIALGSNMSISDVYGKGTENAETQTSGCYDFQSSQFGSSDLKQEKCSSNNNGVIKPSVLDPKWVKASPVPVYKAKLIPNYENQTKYDPRFEGGVKGKAEAVVPAMHAPQVSISSDVYRQELQKKSEQYVGGCIYPTSGQTPASSGSLRGNGSLGAAYTTHPPKLNQYHAFSITLFQNNQRANSSPENISDTYPPSNNPVSVMSEGTGCNQTYGIRNNPENGEVVSSSDYFPQQARQGTDNSELNCIISSERKPEAVKGCNPLPTGAEKGKKAQGDNFPAYRSSSAHSILDRDSESKRWDMGVHSARARPASQQQKNHSHISRKDKGGKKNTPTSHKDQSQASNAAPQSVTSLIDRFEKGTNVNHLSIGLLDISDKPPSMTSTPVVRRKNQGVSTTQPSHGKLAVTKSDGDSSRSQSEGTKRSLSQKEMTNMPEWQKSMQTGSVHSSLDRHFSSSQHQNIATHYTQSQHDEKNRGHKSQSLLKQLQGYQGDGHNTRKYEQTSDQPPQSGQTSEPGESYIPMHPDKQHQQKSDQRHMSDRRSHTHYTVSDKMFSKSSSDPLKSDHFQHSPHNSKGQNSGQSFTPKPQQPHHTLPETSQSQQQHSQNYVGSFSTSHVTIDQPQFQPIMSPSYDNLPQWHQQRQSPQVSYNTQFQSQTPYNSLPINSSINCTSPGANDIGRYNEDFHHRSSNSAFERPLKVATKYGRQPGAMAVVKPTVMNI